MILLVGAIEIALVVGVTLLILHVYGADPVITYVLGAVHATGFVLFYFALRIVFLANDQGAVRQMRGDYGEINTRDELKRAKQRRLIWGWVDSITVAGGDIDHLVITRHGGIVAIDSKWRSDTIGADISRSAIAASRRPVARNLSCDTSAISSANTPPAAGPLIRRSRSPHS